MANFAKSIELVGNCEYWVTQKHTRASIPHDLFYLLFARRLVAVNRAVGAGWLVIAIRTFLKTTAGVVEKLSTACAKIIGRRIVVVGTVDADHLHHRYLLSGKVFLLRSHAEPDLGAQV